MLARLSEYQRYLYAADAMGFERRVEKVKVKHVAKVTS